MSKVLATVLTLLAILAGSSVFAAEQTRTLKVDDKTAIVTFDDAATTLEAVAQASTDVGFPAHPVTDTSSAK